MTFSDGWRMKKLITLFSLFLIGFEGMAHPPWGLVIDKQNNIYFADIVHNGRGSVWKLHSNGYLELLLRDFHAHNVSLDAKGHLITAHGEGHHTVVRFHANGQIDTLHTATDYRQFFGGNCTYSPSGRIIFSAEKFLWFINAEGVRQKISPHRFEWNQAVFADTDGNVYGPDIGRDGGALIKIDANGKSQVLATNLISKLDRPRDKHNDVLLGMAKDPDGYLHIAENAGRRIIKILENGKTETVFKDSEPWYPTGLTFHNGHMYVLEYSDKLKGPRVLKVNTDGNAEIIFDFDTYEVGNLEKPLEKKEQHSLWMWLGLSSGLILIILIIAFWMRPWYSASKKLQT